MDCESVCSIIKFSLKIHVLAARLGPVVGIGLVSLSNIHICFKEVKRLVQEQRM